jgi:protein-S-isoprenylcysteine O-methyltransferase Ste14
MKRLFKALYFAGMGAEIILRTPYERRRGQIAKTDQRVTPAEQTLLAGLTIAGLLLPLIYSVTPWLDFADYGLAPRTKTRVGWLGTGLLVAAVWLFGRAHRDLGTNWSPSLEIGAQQTLTTRGVYRRIRHPMYASQGLWGLAQALLLPNWLAGPGGLLAFLAFYLVRVPQEERMMLEHFGESYCAYSAQTGRVVPRLCD